MSYTAPLKVIAHASRLSDWDRGHRPGPVTVEWSLTNVCQLGCDFCHFGHVHQAGPLWNRNCYDTGKMADKEVAIRAMKEMSVMGVKAVTWMGGGEPTLHPHFDEIAVNAALVGLKQGLYTNGCSLPGPRLGVIANTHDWAVVSLDYDNAEDYARAKQCDRGRFADACRSVHSLVRLGCRVSASFIIGEDNHCKMANMVSLAKDMGCRAVFRPRILHSEEEPSRSLGGMTWLCSLLSSGVLDKLSRLPNVSCDPSRFQAYLDWDGSRPYRECLGIRLNATVTPDGRVWVCPNRMGYDDSCLGDLTKESFSAIWDRHPGKWTDFSRCRVMCRLHGVNCSLAPLSTPLQDADFI